jgi:single-strand DNA-binding protein
MNKVFLIGNLTRDPELTETPSGVPVCRFSIAVNRPNSSQDGERQTDFFNCTAWRGQAETIARFTKKGHKMSVIGSIQLRNYEDNQGVKRTAVDVIVQDFEFLTPKGSESFDDVDVAPRSSSAPAKRKPVLSPIDDDGDSPF